MPIDDFARRVEERLNSPRSGGGGGRPSGLKMHDLFQVIPEGGNDTVSGRDSAAVSFLGHLKRGGVEYDFAVPLLLMWNQRYCRPPLPEGDLIDKAGRLWVEFAQPEEEEAATADAGPPFEFMDIEGMREAAEKTAARGWLVDDLIPAGGLVYLTAPPGVGKTWVALDLIRSSLQSGGRWFGRWPVRSGSVIYIDEEIGAQWAYSRLTRLGVAPGAPLLYSNRAGVKIDNPKHRRWILETIKTSGATLLVLDSLSRVHGLNEDSNAEMARLYGWIREFMEAGATVLMIHHDRKGGQGDSSVRHDRSRGAGELMAQADMVYAVERDAGMLKFVCTKARHVSEDRVPTCHFSIEDDDEAGTVAVCAANHTQVSTRRLDASEEAIVQFLRAAGLSSAKAIREGVSGLDASKMAALQSLVTHGEVIVEPGSSGSKIYYLKPKPAPEGQF